MHTCAARVLNQNLWLNACGFYIIILNKPVALHYKNTHAVIALRNEKRRHKKEAKSSHRQLRAHFCMEKSDCKEEQMDYM